MFKDFLSSEITNKFKKYRRIIEILEKKTKTLKYLFESLVYS